MLDNSEMFPESVKPLVVRLLPMVADILKKGKPVPSVYFIGCTVSGALESVSIDTSSASAKAASAQTARNVAVMTGADYVVTMAEAWMLPASKVAQADDIYQKYGSIANYPHREEVVYFSVESDFGACLGTCAILPEPRLLRKRKLGPLTWTAGDSVGGTLAGILPRSKTVH